MEFPSVEELLLAIRERVAVIPKWPCRAYLSTGWRDWNGFLGIIVRSMT
jgi:hypothetical protein